MGCRKVQTPAHRGSHATLCCFLLCAYWPLQVRGVCPPTAHSHAELRRGEGHARKIAGRYVTITI